MGGDGGGGCPVVGQHQVRGGGIHCLPLLFRHVSLLRPERCSLLRRIEARLCATFERAIHGRKCRLLQVDRGDETPNF